MLQTNPPFACLQPSGPVSSFHESKLLLLDVAQAGNSCARGVPIPASSGILHQHSTKPWSSVRAAPAAQVLGAWDWATSQHRRSISLDMLWGWLAGRRAWPALAAVPQPACPRLGCPVSFQRLAPHPSNWGSVAAPPPAPCPGQGTQRRARSPPHIQVGGGGTELPIPPAPPEPPASVGWVIRTNPGAGSPEPLSSLPRSRSAAVQSVCKAVQSVYAAGTGTGD